MKDEKDKEVVIYSYKKDGVVYHTPNEQIAATRSDDGEYFIEIHNKKKETSKD